MVRFICGHNSSLSPRPTTLGGFYKEYVNVRVRREEFRFEESLNKAIERSEQLLDEMWVQCTRLIQKSPKEPVIILITRSMNEVIDIHSERLAKAIYSRIPESIRNTLLCVAILTLGMMGYHAGISGTRTLVARSGIILAITLVMLLIIDLDRPGESGAPT